MPNDILPRATPEPATTRKSLSLNIHDAFMTLAFMTFRERVVAEGALPKKVNRLIAAAAAHITQCPYCIRGHTKAALRHGATAKEVMEAIRVTSGMRAAGASAQSALALDAIADSKARQDG